MNRNSEIEEAIKSFLIVGETLNAIHTFLEYRYRYILTAVVLTFSSIIGIIVSIEEGVFWLFIGLVLLIGAIYFTLKFQIRINYAITKFRVIRIIEGDILTRRIFRSSQLIGFSDLHYEHVEQIAITTPALSMPKLYTAIFSITIGWVLLGDFDNLNDISADLEIITGIALLIGGLVLLMFTLPTGGVRLVLQSVSGDLMEFPEKQTPREFIDELILNCRTFLSYGAV
ncbi:MAG: hypothetical protein HeimC2_22770 [Candidatus Heimdallarchaeota archaeon LC_2]|nr:MAG: hypothetical protein HeimC2_22770 [Candidatus Heimdallarchaeota archaeon LC_2]